MMKKNFFPIFEKKEEDTVIIIQNCDLLFKIVFLLFKIELLAFKIVDPLEAGFKNENENIIKKKTFFTLRKKSFFYMKINKLP
jgi:hypothetical protein